MMIRDRCRAGELADTCSLLLFAGAPLRRHGFFFLASMGCMIGSFSAFKHSTFRLTGFYPNPSECRRAGIPA